MTTALTSFADFDADAVAGELPRIKIDGHWFTGRILSIIEWFQFKEQIAEQERREIAEGITVATVAASRAICATFLRAIFDPVRIRPWHLRRTDPIALLERYDPHVLERAFTQSFVHTSIAHSRTRPGRSREEEQSSTSGAKTADASPKSQSSPDAPSSASGAVTPPAPSDSASAPPSSDGISSSGGATPVPGAGPATSASG